ncbi:hypothetical protein ACX3PU_10040 [Chryseobacterium sp. A301]
MEEEEPKHNCYYNLDDHFKDLQATGDRFRKWADEESKMTKEERGLRARRDAEDKIKVIKNIATSLGVSPIELIKHTLRRDDEDED